MTRRASPRPVLLLSWLCLASPLAAAPREAPGSVLLIVADDVGIDRIGAYRAHPDPGHTPNVDRLAAEGVLFRNAWATPFCSPARATILTGKYPFRTGIGLNVVPERPLSLALEETLLPEVLPPAWTSIALGKWHLGNLAAGNEHPVASGFDRYAGRPVNLQGLPDSGDFFVWRKTVAFSTRGVPHAHDFDRHRYTTTDTVDDALRAIERTEPPWFVYLAFHAAHTPLHVPPEALHSFELEGVPSDTADLHMKAMVEAMDTELGRLLARVPASTTVIFVADNGTATFATTPPFDPAHAKGTLYQGGIQVPLIVRGPRVTEPGSECTALVNTTDLFATVAELVGATSEAPDSVSLVPYLADPQRPSLREFAYSEQFRPGGLGPQDVHQRAVREARYKLIRVLDRTGGAPSVREELFDLETDRFERTNLLGGRPLTAGAREAYQRLSAELARLSG